MKCPSELQDRITIFNPSYFNSVNMVQSAKKVLALLSILKAVPNFFGQLYIISIIFVTLYIYDSVNKYRRYYVQSSKKVLVVLSNMKAVTKLLQPTVHRIFYIDNHLLNLTLKITIKPGINKKNKKNFLSLSVMVIFFVCEKYKS